MRFCSVVGQSWSQVIINCGFAALHIGKVTKWASVNEKVMKKSFHVQCVSPSGWFTLLSYKPGSHHTEEWLRWLQNGWRVSGIFFTISAALEGFFYVHHWWKSGWIWTQWETQWIRVFISRRKLRQLLLLVRSTCTAASIHAWVCECHSSRVCCDSRASAQVKRKLNWLNSVGELRASPSTEPSSGHVNTNRNVVYYC